MTPLMMTSTPTAFSGQVAIEGRAVMVTRPRAESTIPEAAVDQNLKTQQLGAEGFLDRWQKPRAPASEFVLVAALGLLLMGLQLARTRLLTPDNPDFNVPQDLQNYLFMAQHGALTLHIAPYGWRIGLPLLVSFLPMDRAAGSFVVNFVSLWLIAVVVYYLIRQFAFPRSLAIVGMVMFLSLSWVVKVNLRNFWLTEPPAYPERSDSLAAVWR